MGASGFAGLGYQIVWAQQSALWLGHEAPAVLAVVSAFFGGLALGSWLLAPAIERSTHPMRWFAACEATIAVWALVLSGLRAPVSEWLLALIGNHPGQLWQWSVSLGGTLILLLPATAAMGVTLPALERAIAAIRPDRAGVAVLYAMNTAGAVVGVLATAFWLVPALGLSATTMVCAALNVLCALMAWTLVGIPTEAAPVSKQSGEPGILWLLAATGFLGIGYEVLVVRVLSQVAENTVYTFALLLAVYLVGTSVGSVVYDRRNPSGSIVDRVRGYLLHAVALACIFGVVSMGNATTAKVAIAHWLGDGMAAALAGEAAAATMAFLLPAAAMGALFSHLATTARGRGIGLGRAISANTLGASIAPLVFGVWLVPSIGARFSLLLVTAGYLLLARPRARSIVAWGAAAVFTAAIVFAPGLNFVDVPDGGKIVSYKEGVAATVSVTEDVEGVARLRINNRQQEGSSASLFADGRQALLPLLLHPSPRHALFLGLGTGVTAASAAEDRALNVTAVELLPDVIEASRHFRQRFDRGGLTSPLRIESADARRFVRTATVQYDLIVSDNFHPARSGSAILYTVEHFGAVRARLAPEGIFCQWLPLHQLDLDTLRSIVRSFIAVYPKAFAIIATNSLDTPVVGLIARNDDQGFDPARLRARLSRIELAEPPAAFGLDDDLALFGSFIAGSRSLARFAADAALNTDDRPIVAYRAPRITYAPDSAPSDRLSALLLELSITPQELLTGTVDSTWASRLAAYWSARKRFIDVGRDVRPTADVRRMLETVREPLLAVLRTSPDFRPAFDPLLQMATALAEFDPVVARTLLTELQRLQPARVETASALSNLPP